MGGGTRGGNPGAAGGGGGSGDDGGGAPDAAGSVCTRTAAVGTSAALAAALAAAQPGDCIVLDDGDYTFDPIQAHGTAAAPIVVRARNRGRAGVAKGDLVLQGAAFVTNSYLEGDVDFTWGNGGVFFNACEIRALHRTVSSSTDIFAQIRNGQSQHGNVYLDCRLTGPDLTSADTVFLARIDPTRFPFSQVVYLGCALNPRVAAAGWQLNNATTAPNVQFWEHRSTDLNGNLLNVSGRAPFSRQLTDAQAAQWSSPTFVLGWTPPATAP